MEQREFQEEETQLYTDEHRCPECNSTNIIRDYELNEVVCRGCGTVLPEDNFNRGKDWRSYTMEEHNKRARAGHGTTLTVHDKGLSTTIRIEKDSAGKPLSPKMKNQMWRLRKWQIRSRVHSSKDRNLTEAMSELNRLCDKLFLKSSVHESASRIYRKALDEKLVRGRSISTMAASSLYVALRVNGIPRTLDEISKVSPVEKKDIARCYRLILRELDIKMPIDDPANYVSKIAGKVGLGEPVSTLAYKILKEAKNRKIASGKGPTTLAAAALYLSGRIMNDWKTQKVLAEAANVTEVSVRNRKRGLLNGLKDVGYIKETGELVPHIEDGNLRIGYLVDNS